MQGGQRSNPSLDNEFAIAMAKISQTRILDGFMNHEHGNFHPPPSFSTKKEKSYFIMHHLMSCVAFGVYDCLCGS
jgi:hypothetical protein